MGYRKLFWGFIFLFDLRIGGFDIMPDVIGYVLVYQGLSMLADKNQFFSKAKAFALPMIYVSIFDIYQVTVPINEFSSSSFGILGVILGLIITVINLLMVYNICLGIKEEARVIGHLDLEAQANRAWNLYLISSILVSSSIVLLGILQALFILVFIVSVISYILMLRLMRAARHIFE